MIITTKRLHLRPFEPTDKPAFAQLNADPKVMRHFPEPLDQAASDTLLEKIMQKQAKDGFCFCAVQAKSDGQFLGMAGLAKLDDKTRAVIKGNPEVEIGWRIGSAFWRQGFATEAAIACQDYAWQVLKLPELVAFTTPANTASRRVMEKIGMTHDAENDFEHPHLPKAHALSTHVLYRCQNPLV